MGTGESPLTPGATPRAVRVLSFHARYRCGHTGVCCSSGWDIPVEPTVEERLRAALRSRPIRVREPAPLPVLGTVEAAGALSASGRREEGDRCLRPLPGLAHGARVVLRADAGGRCVFLERSARALCSIHRHLGAPALPAACRDFPRVATLRPLGVSITLSHYCPTAAGLLFGEGPPLAIRTGAPAFPSSWPYEGLDAREALPPLLRPGVLMSWAAHALWETHAVATLGRDDLTPEEALARLTREAEAVRRWAPEKESLDDCLSGVLASGAPSPSADPRPVSPRGREADRLPAASRSPATPEPLALAMDAWELAAATVPESHPCPLSPRPALTERVSRLADEGWAGLLLPVRRWAAAKAFASWVALQGDGLRTAVRGVRLALAVLRAEAARGCLDTGRPLDADGLRAAVRRADLLLVHLADPAALARRLSRAEAEGSPPPAW